MQEVNHSDIIRAIGQLEGKVDSLTSNMNKLEERLVGADDSMLNKQNKMDTRVGSLETSRTRVNTVLSLIITLPPIAWTLMKLKEMI